MDDMRRAGTQPPDSTWGARLNPHAKVTVHTVAADQVIVVIAPSGGSTSPEEVFAAASFSTCTCLGSALADGDGSRHRQTIPARSSSTSTDRGAASTTGCLDSLRCSKPGNDSPGWRDQFLFLVDRRREAGAESATRSRASTRLAAVSPLARAQLVAEMPKWSPASWMRERESREAVNWRSLW